MSSLLNIGISGLNAAQVALATVSNNIANASTSGYSEERVDQVETIGGESNSQYTIGSGVDVVAVQRAYSQFLTTALWSSNSNLQAATTTSNLTSTLNSAFSGSGNLQTALDNLYSGFSSVANSPSSSSVRQSVLGDASSLTSVYNTLGQQLSQQSSQVNQQIGDTVTSINGLTSQIATLNQQILASGSNSNPNSLLDQRDQLIQQLAGFTGISTATDSNGSIAVYTSSGDTLVSGAQSYALASGPNQYDPGSTDVFDTSGNDITSQLSGGSLGALVSYRNTVLEPAQNALGQSAIALASSVNAQQADGLNLNGQQGQAIFSVGSPDVLPSSTNAGSASVSASISDVSQLTTSDYILRYTGSGTGTNGWSLSTTTGQSVALTANSNGSLSADGLTLNVSGTAQTGDSYEIEPTRNASTSLTVSMTDPNGIAAAAALAGTAATANTGTATVSSVSVTNSSNANLLSGATVTFGAGGAYTITDGAGNTTTGTYTSGQPITADGWSLSLSGTPASGDSFTVAANTNGLNSNANALALAGLADSGVLDGGKTSVVDSYSNLTTQVGDAGSLATSDLTTQTNLYNEAASNQQSLAGVNLNTEAASLVQYQQAYQASAQVISTAQQLFTSLITAIEDG
ncbi:flagellar hook-associated protein FlgK [Dyella dinghuensis]|uniref:Flagellar hook-associated protein 1 n=1 Tax=Dyella dinghuensis TaxID=1920169 RepID=A0A432LR43_9GAMM|nr:flagellar hook-associated protein FlgK [Dyella dinghuensis]RUL62993.1 flagellar hook-associated protein FlgK [Dyella dinghuensis]